LGSLLSASCIARRFEIFISKESMRRYRADADGRGVFHRAIESDGRELSHASLIAAQRNVPLGTLTIPTKPMPIFAKRSLVALQGGC
jgi:hypothetical protein